jgi:cytochrome c oxidase subunit IV
MRVWPGGDSYFGALLNSWIHVMMYSYYALSLLKIRCPWKKYLTQSQLLQFLSVLVYTFVSYLKLKGTITWSQTTCFIVQTGEMVSLFVLFLHFYQKAYSKNKALKNKNNHSDASDSASDTAAEQASLSSASTDEADEHQASS